MNFSVRFRLMALGLAVALMGALIVFVTFKAEREVSELRVRLNGVASESAGIIDQFRDSVRKLNTAMLRYGTERDPAVWETILETSADVNGWIQKQKTVLRTQDELDLLQQIQAAYTNYLQAVENFHSKMDLASGRSAPLADFALVREQSQRLLDLGQSLARLHYKAHDDLMWHTNYSLTQLHSFVLILLTMLFAYGLVLAFGIYRHLIAPMQSELMKTQAFAKRHEKLASLGLLASSVAQEARNPLTSIKIGVSFQKGKFQPGTSEWADAETVEREILRLEQVLDNFLAHTEKK